MPLPLTPLRHLAHWIARQEGLAFALTNHIPRHAATRFMGWFSRIEQPLVRDASIALLQAFAGDLRLHEAAKTSFTSLHDCFVRELKPGARPIDTSPTAIVSPCDGIVGAFGTVQERTCLQAKGFTYTLEDLLGDAALARTYRNGTYVTLRLSPAMYHRFHAPYPCRVDRVTYVSGDIWNVHPATLRRVPRVFCRNERAIVPLRFPEIDQAVTLVPVAAVLVASIRFTFLDVPLDLTHRGVADLPCQADFQKGDEMGHFHHGSTIIVLARQGIGLHDALSEGTVVRMGQALLRHP
jgi:phosphatidylserine decarboxylase